MRKAAQGAGRARRAGDPPKSGLDRSSEIPRTDRRGARNEEPLVAMPMMRNSPPSMNIRPTCPVPDPRSRGAAKQCAPVLSKGRQGLGTTNLRRPTSSAMQYRGRERSHDVRHRRLGELRWRCQCAFRNPITAITRQSPQASGSALWRVGYVRSSITNRFVRL